MGLKNFSVLFLLLTGMTLSSGLWDNFRDNFRDNFIGSFGDNFKDNFVVNFGTVTRTI